MSDDHDASSPEALPISPIEGGVFGAGDLRALFALADIVVPRDGEHPAASEIDFLAPLEAWIASTATRRLLYRALWPELARSVAGANAGELKSDAQLESSCSEWAAEARRLGASASSSAKMFEQLRRDVLRIYYSSEAGWASLGFTGPAIRTGSSPLHPAHAASRPSA